MLQKMHYFLCTNTLRYDNLERGGHQGTYLMATTLFFSLQLLQFKDANPPKTFDKHLNEIDF